MEECSLWVLPGDYLLQGKCLNVRWVKREMFTRNANTFTCLTATTFKKRWNGFSKYRWELDQAISWTVLTRARDENMTNEMPPGQVHIVQIEN